MGRVYNALVRAERWKDSGRPIGAPVRADDEPRAKDPSTTTPFNTDSPAISPLAFEANFASPQESADPAEWLIATRAAQPSAATRASARKVSPSPRPISQVVTLEPALFEEPNQVSHVNDLTIDPHFAALTGKDSSAAEKYQSLAVKLLSLAERRKLKTVLITSAEAAEGKTTVATNVAWLLAKRPERRVLLIDASPASSSVTRALGINPKHGWLDLADRSCKREQAIIRLDPSGLYTLPPGPRAATQPADALSPRIEKLIAELSPQFELIVVDSPAIVESPETQRLAAVLDGAVIVARAGRTRHSKVTAARKLVPKEHRLGLVLNESEAGADITDRSRKANSLGRLFGRKR